jgi:UDP-2,3-diacylglucosamine pyrophosphatase LpxH
MAIPGFLLKEVQTVSSPYLLTYFNNEILIHGSPFCLNLSAHKIFQYLTKQSIVFKLTTPNNIVIRCMQIWLLLS